MHPAVIAVGLFGTVFAATAKTEHSRVKAETLEASVRKLLANPKITPAELLELARALTAEGHPALAETVRATARERDPAAVDPAARRAAVAEIVKAWRKLGGNDAATVQLEPELVMQAQRLFGLEPSGRWDLATAMLAQAEHTEAPSAGGALPMGLALEEIPGWTHALVAPPAEG